MRELAVIGGAMGGGGGGDAPHTPVIQPDSLRSNSIIEVVEAIGEGEFEGFATADPLESVYLDDTALKTDGTMNFSGVSLDYRLGTQNQTYIQGSVDNSSAALEAVNVDVLYGSPIIRSISDTTTDAIRVTIKFGALMKSDSATGDRMGITVQLAIDVRLDGGAWLPADLQGRGYVSGKTESSYERSYHINLKAMGTATTYDVRVTRLSANPGTGEFSAFQWESYSKLSYAKLRYPNTVIVRTTFDARHFSSIPSRGYKMKGIKVQVPTPDVYNPVTRVYTGADWGGSFVTAWTRNPAWIFYDLITNPRYGLGELVNPIYQDKWTLFSIAKRCDDLVPDGFGGQEYRYSLDLYLQQDDDAKKVIMDIASAFDAMAYWASGSIFMTQDAPKSVSVLFVPGNVVGGRFSYAGSSRQVRYTVALVQWNDPNDNYRIATEYVEDRDGIDRYGYREKQIAAIGCTSRGQTHRAGKRILLTSRLETDTVTFSIGLDGISVQPGQVIRIADPLRAGDARQGGRVHSGSGTQFITLDAPVTLASGITYKLAVIAADGSVIDAPIQNAAGSHSVIECNPQLPSVPEADAAWIVYDPNALGKLYRVVSVSENENKDNGFYTLTAVQYAPEKYAELDNLNDLPPLPNNPFVNNSVVPPSGLIVTEGVYAALEGIRRYLDLSWSASTDRFLRGYRLVYRRNGALLFDSEIDGQSYRIMNPETGDWEITLSAVTTFGKFSTSITVLHALDEMYLVESVSVTDLVLVSGGTSFSGRSPEFDWDTDALTVLGYSDTYAAGQGGQSPWFRDYQVDIYNGATLLRSDFVTESRYVYSYDKNLEDGGPRRTVKITVRARDTFGRYSQPATLTVSNPTPAAIGGVSIYSGAKSLLINYTRPTDNDWVGVIVFLSTTTGFTPAAGNRVYVGSDTTITLPNLSEGVPYFLRFASYDAFGGISDYTLSGTEYTKTIDSIAAPSPTDIKNGLQTALDDPAATPLVFEADVFAINLTGVDKTPFIIGVHEGSPAVLLDADVVVTGTLSADQLVGGRIAATEDIIVGNGNARINGDGSMIVYNGADTVSNRDFAVLSGGTLSFQRYRGGAYREYKSVRRVEYGQAASGATVTLPGYWDAQPRLIVSPASLRSYDSTYPSAKQTWTVRADNLAETSTGSSVWEFDAIAELNYADSAGTVTVADNSGALTVNSWTSGESILPIGTVSVTVTAKFSSTRGNGTSTYGYYYRTVSWTVQGWNGATWSNIETQSRNITAAEHGQQITDTNAITIAAGISKIKVVYVASDTNGSVYAIPPYSDVFNFSTATLNSNGANAIISSNGGYATLTSASYSPPSGSQIYAVDYSLEYKHVNFFNTSSIAYTNNNYVYSVKSTPNFPNFSTVSTGQIASASYNNTFWTGHISITGNGAEFFIQNPSAVIYLKTLVANDTTPANNYIFQDYAWNITGSTAIAVGSLNWMAVGD